MNPCAKDQTLIGVSLVSSPGHSQLFNVARRKKTGGPGIQNNVHHGSEIKRERETPTTFNSALSTFDGTVVATMVATGDGKLGFDPGEGA